MDLRNLTRYAHKPAVLYDHRGREVYTVVIKASFRLSDGTPHADPLPVYASDVVGPLGAVLYPADFVPDKRGTDVVCNGSVYAPAGAPVSSCVAELRIGEVRARVRAFGRRYWKRASNTAWEISEPEPFQSVPLGMASAFGGAGDFRNPLGRGFFQGDPQGRDLPQLEVDSAAERIASPSDRPPIAGFSAVPPQWEPRRKYAGTYGDTWQRVRAPLLPEDMDARFWNAAQVVSDRPFVGGEPIELLNLSPSGRWVTQLPRVPLRVHIGGRDVRPTLDLVVLEPDVDRVTLTFRVSIGVTGCLDGRLPKVRIVEKRLVTPDWTVTQ